MPSSSALNSKTLAEEPVSGMPYPQPGGAYDETFDSERSTRPHWQRVIDSITKLGQESMENRQRQAHRILRDDGATYNLNSDPLSPSMWSECHSRK